MAYMNELFRVARTGVSPSVHAVLGSSMSDEAGLARRLSSWRLGAFWGVEKAMWNAPGVVTTATGYMGGHTAHPTYRQVCSHTTGHAEVVRVLFDTSLTSAADLIRLFFEIHDPTQVGGQGNDIGDQYRSQIWTTTPDQLRVGQALREAYQEILSARDFGPIQTVISPAPSPESNARFWLAEEYHQQYLAKNPGGYECHARTGVACPALPYE